MDMQLKEHQYDSEVQELGLLAAYAHGSQVDGSARPDSDLDLALFAPHDWAPDRFNRIAEEFAGLVARKTSFPTDLVHVQNLGAAPAYFRFRVLSQGLLLGVADTSALAQLQARSFCEAWDEKIYLKPMLEAFRARTLRADFAS